MKTAILVDGPRQGARYGVQDGSQQLLLPIVPAFDLASALANPGVALPNFEQVYYRLHRCILFGREIVVGTVKNGYPDQADLIEILLSDEAKEAIA